MQRVLPFLFSFSFLLPLVGGCSNVIVNSKTNVSVSFDPPDAKQAKNYQKVYIPFEKDFYGFGLIPTRQEINVDQLIADAGFSHFRRFRLVEDRDFKNMMIGVFTFGLWTPKKYYIVGYGKRDL